MANDSVDSSRVAKGYGLESSTDRPCSCAQTKGIQIFLKNKKTKTKPQQTQTKKPHNPGKIQRVGLGAYLHRGSLKNESKLPHVN